MRRSHFVIKAAQSAAFAVFLASCFYQGSTATKPSPRSPRAVNARPRSALSRKAGRHPKRKPSDRQVREGRFDATADLDPLTDSAYEEQAAFVRAPIEEAAQLGVFTPIEDSSGQALSAFYAALGRAQKGEGHARVVFYGASHVASDYLTGYIRQQLQARFGAAGPGFVLPAKPWRWYRNEGIFFEPSRGWNTVRVKERDKKRDRYGLAGVALDAARRRPAFTAFRTRANGQSSGQVNRVELYYLRQPNGGRIEISVDTDKPLRISTAAEQFEAGYELIEAADGLSRLEVRTVGEGAVRLFGVAIESDKPGVVLDTLGVPGARASYHLEWDETLYREHLQRRRPDLVVLAYGTNEAGDKDVPIQYYESGLRRVVARIRDIIPNASCLLIGPSDRPERVGEDRFEARPRIADIIEAQKRVASDYSCGFFDLVRCTGGPMSMVVWAAATPPYGSADHVHFTPLGYKRIGELFLQALLARYPDSK